MEQTLKENLSKDSTWMRALYMILFAILYSVAEIVITVVVVFQFFAVLITGKNNSRLLKLGQSLSTWVYQVMLYLTFNSEYQPYPFGAWPRGAPTPHAKDTAPPPEKEPQVSAGKAEPGSEHTD